MNILTAHRRIEKDRKKTETFIQDRFKDSVKQWHVVMNLMDPPGYRAERGGFGTEVEFSSWFKTNKEAQDYVDNQKNLC